MIRDEIRALLQDALATLSIQTESIPLAHPEDPKHGDFATSIALQFAKQQQSVPHDLAQKIADSIPKNELIQTVEIARPGFINIFLRKEVLMKELNIINQTPEYGSQQTNEGKIALVEYSSPNIAKPFTIGHLRSTIIGDSIANILEATGYDVKRDNHVGDWGTQFGKLIYAIKTWGSIEEIEASEHPIKLLVKLYIKFHEEAEHNVEIEEKARDYFRNLEQGDSALKEIWQKCIEWSWREFEAIYRILGVTFTENNGRGYGESYFENELRSIHEELKNRKLTKISEGAELVFFENDKYPPLMVRKKDGASLYATRDLATDRFRKKTYGDELLIINEVGAEQSLYFQQLYEVERLLGWFAEGQRKHVKHGLYRFKDMKMSTRKGNTVWLYDVLTEAVQRAKKFNKSGIDVSSEVAVAALKWNDLKRSPHLDIIFDWDEILSMEGNSGPYMLYTYVRIQSVLRQGNNDFTLNDVYRGEATGEENSIVRLLCQFPEVIEQAAQNFAPHVIANYLFALAQSYNLFYQKLPILKAEPDTRRFRLAISHAVGVVVKNGLRLLGIKTVEQM